LFPQKKTLSSDSNPENIVSMKDLVYSGSGNIEFKDIPKPGIEKPMDAFFRLVKTTICGTDYGILHGKTPTVKPRTTLGHQGVGVIEEVAASVRNFKKGDHVIISCITADGTYEY
jgi:alcohol dehydrogenase